MLTEIFFECHLFFNCLLQREIPGTQETLNHETSKQYPQLQQMEGEANICDREAKSFYLLLAGPDSCLV